MEGKERIGLIAGWGDFPLAAANSIVASGYDLVVIGIRGHANRQLAELAKDYVELGLGRFGAAVRYFRRHRVHRVVLAGKVFKTRILVRFAWLKHWPDWLFWRYFYQHFWTGGQNRNDDTLLLTVTKLFKDHGMNCMPATDFAPELLVNPGPLTRRRVSELERKDIQFGWQIAKEMGRLDIGQCVCIKGQTVLAVEAIEGTDDCIRRAGELCSTGGIVVVKVAKPQQDMRFDVPTVGVGTIEAMQAAGPRVLAI
ncbi:MAG TPA: UDP-2,3-diacylglucosamine diphosphatase LpxI, partial [Pirellulaceae bacterium]|nr:UDP-2,3-diacylglucosamine diphosphatase LpxI [Pirellulaceae bacterium]